MWYPAQEGILGVLTPPRDAPLAEGGPFPTVVYSHGFSSSRDEGAYLARHLSTHGFVVVAADFPLTTLGTLGGPVLADVATQPADVRFVLDLLLAASEDLDGPLGGAVDPERIAAAGTSLGGLTTSIVAYHRRFRDPRVRVAVTLAGPGAMFAGPTSMDPITTT